MAMIKYVSPSGWDFDRPTVVPIKASSRGVVGEDRRDFVKMAGSNVFLPELDKIKFAADEYPVHMIALGASGYYGPNRNGDAFTEETCKRDCSTFTKFAKCFRSHKNKPAKGDPHYGVIKAAAYNSVMHRVELLAALNMTKSACERNGGLLADVELEKLAKDGDYPVSMACRTPFDLCSFCGNKAKTRAEYCTEATCGAGGCKDNLTRLVKVGGDVHQLHVKNPNCVWFDISRVFRPADRIAYGAPVDYLDKVASDADFGLPSLWKSAEDATAPIDVIMYQDGTTGQWTTKTAAQVKLAYGLAKLDEIESRRDTSAYSPFAEGVQGRFPIEALSGEKLACALGALAAQKIILPIRDFARLSNCEHLSKEAAARLPGVFCRLIEDESLEQRLEHNKYACDSVHTSSAARFAATACFEGFSMDSSAVEKRGMLAAIRGVAASRLKPLFEKSAADDGAAEQLARDYAVYKIAALEKIAAFDTKFGLTARYSIRQNYVV